MHLCACVCVYAPVQKTPCDEHHKQEEIKLKAKSISGNTINSSSPLISAVMQSWEMTPVQWAQAPGLPQPRWKLQVCRAPEHHPGCLHHAQPLCVLLPRALCSASSTHTPGAGRGGSTEPWAGEMLMLQQQSSEGSSSQRDLAGLRLHGTKAKAKSACKGNEEDIYSRITMDEGLATGRNKLTRRESCLAGSSHDSDHHFSGDKHRAA